MAAYSDLPWIPSAQQFLQTFLEARDAGLKKSQLLQNEPRNMGGGFARVIGGPDLMEQAQIERLKSQTRLAEQNEAEKKAAFEMKADLIRRGASEEEAAATAGTDRFGDNPKPTENKLHIANMGQGGLWAIDTRTGQTKNIAPGTPAKEKEATYTATILPEGVTPAQAAALGIQGNRITGTIDWFSQNYPDLLPQIFRSQSTNSASTAGTNSFSAPSGNRYIVK